MTPHDRTVDVVLWVLTFASAGLTLLLSLGPVPPGASAFPNVDKVFHGVAYFVTTLLFLFAAVWRPGRGSGPFAGLATYAILAVVAAGLLVEAMQGVFTAEREPELADWLAEVFGAVAAFAIHRLVWRLAARPHAVPEDLNA